ncbi:MAG: hypothetical protein HY791_33560 [Deltaproteobacteria bacterium]|nr:hypothetical protein [Deltaproteobacteria bacterium]
MRLAEVYQDFMRRRLIWLPLATFLACRTTSAPPAPALERISIEASRSKLQKISPRKVQLWVVVHVRAHKTLAPDGSVDEARLISGAVSDADAVVEGGGDAIILINSRCEMPLYERVIEAVRTKHQKFPLGISALDYGPKNVSEGFRLAKRFDAQIVWAETVPGERIEYEDDDGSFKPAELIDPAWALGLEREVLPSAMLVAGVHMKYTRPVDGRSFPDAIRASIGLVDGINVTGPKTGVLAEVAHVATAREAAGKAVMGLASGVSVDNIASVIDRIDYAIVGTSLKDPNDELRTSKDRVRALRLRMDELGGGAPN